MSLRNLLPKSLTARLYAGGLLAFAAVFVLAIAALVYADRTQQAAQRFYTDGLTGVVAATELEMLIEQYRRVIETAPVDFESMEADRNDADAEALVSAIRGLLGRARSPSLRQLAPDLAPLEKQGKQVLHLARNFGQEQALAAVGEHTRLAKAFVEVVRRHKADKLNQTSIDVQRITAASQRLTTWVLGSAMLALVIIGPIGLGLVRSVVHRMHPVMAAMQRLAHNDTAVVIPATLERDEVGDIARAVKVFQHNAIELLDKQQSLKRLNGWLDIALNNMARGLSMFDAEERLVLCNARYREIYAMPEAASQTGMPFSDILRHVNSIDASSSHRRQNDCSSGEVWQQALMMARSEGSPVTRLTHLTDGRCISVTFQPLPGGGWVDLHEDVTEQQAAEEKIRRLAQIDTLTEVGNRHHFREQLLLAYQSLPDTGGFAVHWIDLDRFKEVNDTLGHPVGDALLKQVAARLDSIMRREDFVARLGGDEFAVIQGSALTEDQSEIVARRILAKLTAPYEVLGNRVSIGASIGVAMAPRNGKSPDDLLKNADIALYKAKAAGRGKFVFFRPEHETEVKDRHQLENDLRQAIGTEQLELHYQPIVDLVSGVVLSCEALMRWRHPERGMIPPVQFIPIAEESGLIVDLGAWALRRACADAASWPAPTRVAVNLSAVQFGNHDLAHVTQEALTSAGLPAERLELEITESLLLKDDSRTTAILHKLRASGVSIALDDFGTGFASLSYLRKFPFDKIKIDQTFVRDLPDREDCEAIVRAVTGLARMLDMLTIAEGVETAEHLMRARAAGCNAAQGYYFSRPVRNAELLAVLAGCSARLLEAA
jgi:diguanylate cyclase (GGDEF)-like protein